MPCYEKVLTRFSQVGASKQKLFGLSVKFTDLAYFCERIAPELYLWITNFPYHAHSRLILIIPLSVQKCNENSQCCQTAKISTRLYSLSLKL